MEKGGVVKSRNWGVMVLVLVSVVVGELSNEVRDPEDFEDLKVEVECGEEGEDEWVGEMIGGVAIVGCFWRLCSKYRGCVFFLVSGWKRQLM
jgi:hypothetical protein